LVRSRSNVGLKSLKKKKKKKEYNIMVEGVYTRPQAPSLYILLTRELLFQDSKLLVRAVRELDRPNEAGLPKVPWGKQAEPGKELSPKVSPQKSKCKLGTVPSLHITSCEVIHLYFIPLFTQFEEQGRFKV